MRKSFAAAFRGLAQSLKSERNMRFHFVVAFYVILAAGITGASRAEIAVLFICIALVIGAEMLNTALEKLCDTVHPEKAEGIRSAKDISAGAVLVCSILSAAVGLIIFIDPDKLAHAAAVLKQPLYLIEIIVSLPIAAYLIFRRNSNDK